MRAAAAEEPAGDATAAAAAEPADRDTTAVGAWASLFLADSAKKRKVVVDADEDTQEHIADAEDMGEGLTHAALTKTFMELTDENRCARIAGPGF